MPSTTSSSVARLLASSTVMTPSLPTRCIALAIISPISRSPLAEIEPTCAISAFVETFLERFTTSSMTAATARSMPRFRSIGFIPAATALTPSRTIAGLGGALLDHLRAHVLELVDEIDLLRHRHAVLGDARRAVRLVEHDVAPLGAERHLDGVGENVEAAQHAIARVGMKPYFLGCHDVLPKRLCATEASRSRP